MKLHVSSSPHVHAPQTTQSIMRDVLIALAPATVVAIVYFGLNALILVAVSVAAAVLTEWIIQKLTHKKVTISDCSAAVTGLLLALNLPVGCRWWAAALGAAFAIAIVKQAFGGLGQNFMNPALAARAVLMTAYPAMMSGTSYQSPNFWGDAVSGATPLSLLKDGYTASLPFSWEMFLGLRGGVIGEVCTLALVIGLVYLLIRRVITWHIPVIYIGLVFLAGLVLNGFNLEVALCYTLGGGLFLGAIFMATDYTTNPNTIRGQAIFAVGCAILTVCIRQFGSMPEGVSYSILLMNLVTPLIDRFINPPLFGRRKRHAA